GDQHGIGIDVTASWTELVCDQQHFQYSFAPGLERNRAVLHSDGSAPDSCDLRSYCFNVASKLFDGTDVKHRIAWSAGVQSLADQHGERLAVSDASGNAL